MATTIPKAGLRTIFATLSGHAEDRVLWDGESESFAGVHETTGKTGHLVLSVVSRRSIGEDEETREYPDDNTTRVTVSGHRAITLQVRAEEYDEDEGFDILEAIKLDLSLEDTRDAIAATGVALATVDNVRPLDTTKGNRSVSGAVLELVLNQAVSRTFDKLTSSGDTYINEVELAGEGEDLSRIASFSVSRFTPKTNPSCRFLFQKPPAYAVAAGTGSWTDVVSGYVASNNVAPPASDNGIPRFVPDQDQALATPTGAPLADLAGPALNADHHFAIAFSVDTFGASDSMILLCDADQFFTIALEPNAGQMLARFYEFDSGGYKSVAVALDAYASIPGVQYTLQAKREAGKLWIRNGTNDWVQGPAIGPLGGLGFAELQIGGLSGYAFGGVNSRIFGVAGFVGAQSAEYSDALATDWNPTY